VLVTPFTEVLFMGIPGSCFSGAKQNLVNFADCGHCHTVLLFLFEFVPALTKILPYEQSNTD